MKKIIYLLIIILSVTLFSGCGEKYTPQNTESNIQTSLPEKDDISPEALKAAEKNITKDGVYTTPATVAAYLHTFNKLPPNFITKKEAQKLGWNKGDLNDVCPGKSIGGDYFGNYENVLPKGSYHECDINYTKGARGKYRIVYSDKGDIYYSDDHYKTFKKLY